MPTGCGVEVAPFVSLMVTQPECMLPWAYVSASVHVPSLLTPLMQYGSTAVDWARRNGQDTCVHWIEKVVQGVCESQG